MSTATETAGKTAGIKLYTPEILALATSLAGVPFDPAMPLHGNARSPSCGSTLSLSLAVDEAGYITAIGIRAQACAIGQASAALFAAAATGRDRNAIAQAEQALREWLAGDGDQPDWPGLEAIAPARTFPARHGAILLAWRAAIAAFSGS